MNARDLYANEEPLSSLIEAVCVRPAMYTINGTLEEGVAFLNGFHSGMAQHDPHQIIVVQWSKFCQWACDQMGTNDGWYSLARAIRLLHADDENAFAQLAALCIQYQREFGALAK